MERMAGAADQHWSPSQSETNNKRPINQDPQDDSPPKKVSKTNNNTASHSYSHLCLSNNESVPVLDLAELRHAPASSSCHAGMSTNHGSRPHLPHQAGYQHGRPSSDSWSAWSEAHSLRSTNTDRYGLLPTCTHEFSYNDDLDLQVKHILASAVHNLGKGNAQPFDFPYKYILRGPEKVKATINSVTLPEHLWGIFRIMHDPKTVSDIALSNDTYRTDLRRCS